MMILFITEQGSKLVKQGHVLMVYKNGEKLFMYPLETVSQLVLMGRIEVSTALLSLLMREGIDTLLMTRYGQYKGRISGPTSKNIFVREQQFLKRTDPQTCLYISKQLILAKIINTRNMLRRHHPPVYEDYKTRINNALKTIPGVSTLSALRGLEGSFGALYFGCFSRLLNGNFTFNGRKKHPPPDPVNAMLSFGYTLLFNIIYALVESSGLDPYAGFYHQSSYGHPALVSDLMEPYRAPVVDRLVIQLINKQEIVPEDFQKEEKGYRFQEEGLKKFVTAFQKKLFSRYMMREKKETLWGILQRDVWNFMQFLQGDRDEVTPYIFQ
ncbi:MAG: CRISPR-associated endonuclease Cas1 [Calditrichaeota bacterium]|nr:MAG: CRISPR-associated endonuclease Cas1 [Calditrichota bacterium]